MNVQTLLDDLNALGSVDAIADRLREAKLPMGKTNSCSRCPIALYLRKMLNDDNIVVGGIAVYRNDGMTALAVLPEFVSQFVDAIDNGKFDDLADFLWMM